MRLPTLPWFFECMKEHEAAKKLGAQLEFGREPFTRVTPGESIVLVDVTQGEVETMVANKPQSNKQLLSDGNRYHYPFNRAIAGEALIIAVAVVAGARRQDHVETCDAVVNNFANLAYETARDRKKSFLVRSCGYVKPKDQASGELEDGYVEVGCRYLLRFFIDCPIVSKPISVATIGGETGATFNTTVNVPFNGEDHEITFPS